MARYYWKIELSEGNIVDEMFQNHMSTTLEIVFYRTHFAYCISDVVGAISETPMIRNIKSCICMTLEYNNISRGPQSKLWMWHTVIQFISIFIFIFLFPFNFLHSLKNLFSLKINYPYLTKTRKLNIIYFKFHKHSLIFKIIFFIFNIFKEVITLPNL